MDRRSIALELPSINFKKYEKLEKQKDDSKIPDWAKIPVSDIVVTEETRNFKTINPIPVFKLVALFFRKSWA